MTFYRKGVWFVKGMREYTKGGYEAASKGFTAADYDINASGRSFMITGGNSGIGKAAAITLAKKGGTVHLVCRSQERGQAAVDEIKSETGNENVHLHLLDMSSMKDVVQFGRDFEQAGHQLNVLVNNAGWMVNTRELTAEGIEKNFALNTLGTYILTMCMIPVLKRSTSPRVILVTSGGMLLQKLDLTDMQFEKMTPFEGTMAYAQNKRQQVIITERLAEEYPDIHFSCMHPGWADTPAVRSSMPDFHAKMKNRLRTPEEGGDTIVWLAMTDAALKQPSGLFFQDRKSVSKHLPLAMTKSSKDEEQKLMTILKEFHEKYNTV